MSHIKGISVPHRKNTAESVPVRMPAPKIAYYPMTQHIGAPATPTVKKGDAVCVGTLIGEAAGFVSSPIYSGVSGTVKSVEETLQPSGAAALTVIVECDGLQTPDSSIAPPEVCDKESFISAIRASGVVGLGGAGFPTSVKLGTKDSVKIEIMVINGAECEPYLTGDTRTMIDRADEIAEGIELCRRYLGVESFVIGIEKNKPQCIKNMRKIAADHSDVRVAVLPSSYPQGAEKVITYNTTGRVIGEGKLPIDCGVAVVNCTTLASVARYVKTGIPLVEKCITVAGGAVAKPANVTAPIGTPVGDVFDFCGGFSGGACRGFVRRTHDGYSRRRPHAARAETDERSACAELCRSVAQGSDAVHKMRQMYERLSLRACARCNRGSKRRRRYGGAEKAQSKSLHGMRLLQLCMSRKASARSAEQAGKSGAAQLSVKTG